MNKRVEAHNAKYRRDVMVFWAFGIFQFVGWIIYGWF